MTEDYAKVIRKHHVTVAERHGAIVGVIVLTVTAEGFLYTHEKMTENLALYSKIGYVEYDRRTQGEFSLVYLRKHLAWARGKGAVIAKSPMTWNGRDQGIRRCAMRRTIGDGDEPARRGAGGEAVCRSPTPSEVAAWW